MLSLIDDLLDVGAIEAGEVQIRRESTNFAEFLTNCAKSLGQTAGAKGIALVLEPPAASVTVEIDPVRMSQIVVNLVTNAIKFSEPGTTVRLGGVVHDTQVEISVADEGPGIPADEHATIFADFGRASTRPTAGESSTGLGLAIVKRLAGAHGASVELRSVLGEGSTFRVILPRGSTR